MICFFNYSCFFPSNKIFVLRMVDDFYIRDALTKPATSEKNFDLSLIKFHTKPKWTFLISMSDKDA